MRTLEKDVVKQNQYQNEFSNWNQSLMDDLDKIRSLILWEKRNWNLEFVWLDQNYNEWYVSVEEGSIKLKEMRDKHRELIEK